MNTLPRLSHLLLSILIMLSMVVSSPAPVLAEQPAVKAAGESQAPDLTRPVEIASAVAQDVQPGLDADEDGWMAYMTENFEETFPRPLWDTKVNQGGQAKYKWGKDDYKASSGAYSAWVAAVPTSGAPQLQNHYYPANMNTGMAYGPFSLKDVSAARLRFKLWIDVESNKDDFSILVTTDIDGGWSGPAFSGSNKSWQDIELDFNDVGESSTSFIGEPQVYIAFLFRSDGSSNTQYEGVFIDDVVLDIKPIQEVCYSLTWSVNPQAGGSVEVLSPTDYNCSDGTDRYRAGTDITLVANENEGYAFAGWTGDLTGDLSIASLEITKDTNITANFESDAPPVCYTLTVNQPAEGGTIAVSTPPNCPNPGETEMYLSGTTVHLAANADPGYSFSKWSGAGGSASDGTVTMNGDKIVSASFTKVCYALVFHASPESGGTVTANPGPNCGDKYTYGSEVTLTATPGAGYKFSSWTGATAKPGQPNKAEVTMDRAQSVTANFQKDCYKLTITTNPGGSGSVTPDPAPTCSADSYYNGEVVTLTATPGIGYKFDSWTGANPEAEPHVAKVTMNAAKEVTANFESMCYTLTTESNPGGGGTVTVNTTPNCGDDQYTHGTLVSVTAKPANGYAFTSWTGADDNDEVTTTVTMTANKTVIANFTKECYTLTTVSDPENGGTVTVKTSENCGASEYEYGTVVTVSASPNQGFSFEDWEGASGTMNEATVTMTGHMTVTAHFIKDAVCYSLNITADPAAGEVERELVSGEDCGSGKYEEGAEVKLTAVPASGYSFSQWEGGASGTDTVVIVTMDEDKAITAHFTRDPVCYSLDITVSPADTGSVTADPESSPTCGEDEYEAGTAVTLTAAPADGYVFSQWEGGASGTSAEIQVTMDSDKEITAVFTEAPPVCYSLIVDVDPKEGGKVIVETPANCGENMYTLDTKVNLTAVANDGYVFKTWSGDTTSTNSLVELTMSKDQAVTAIFEKQQEVKHLLFMPILRRP